MTKRVRGYIRDPADGSGVSGATVALKLHNGGSTVTSDATDANGLFEIDADTAGYPGPVYSEVTVGSTVKVSSGNVWGMLGGLVWASDIPDVLSTFGIGVLDGVTNELEVTANSSGMQVHVNSGAALLKDGCPYIKEATSDVTITTADATNPRIDRIVLRLTREGQTDQGKVTLIALAGTPAASPVAPSMTQTSATWDMSLATVLVDASASTISSGKVTDTRTLLRFGDASGPSSASDNGLVLFSGTGGKTLKQSALSGISVVTAGVHGVLAQPSGLIVGTTALQTLTNKTMTAPTITGPITVSGADPAVANTPVGTYPGAGTTPGSVTITGSDACMVVTFTTGSAPTTGAMFKVTFATAMDSSSYAVIALPQNNGASQIEAYPTSKATTDFVLTAKVAPPASTSISFAILIVMV